MGRKSRHKLERRLGQLQSTPKQVQRATLKAQRRARNVPPTVEAYERVAASGPTRLIEALIGRHPTRIDNLDAVAQLSMDHCRGPLVSVCQLDAIFIRQGHQLSQHSPPHESPWPTHLSWSLESTIAALRLMLAGQTIGAAIILRQQLGRWTLLLARAGPVVRRRGEPIESFIARAWTQRAMDMLGRYTFDVALDDIFDDLDDHPRTTGAIDTDHEHVQIDGRALCPAHVYHTLCELIDGQHADQRVDCAGCARPRRRALTDRYKRSGRHSLRCVGAVHDSDATGRSNDVRLHKRPRRRCTESLSYRRCPSEAPSSTPRKPHYPVSKSVPTRLSPALVSLVDREFAAFDAIADLGPLYTDYHTALADGHTAQHWTPQQLAELTFAAHRFSRLLITSNARDQDREISDERLKIHQHLTRGAPVRLDRGVRSVVRAVEPIPTRDRRRRHTDLLDAARRILALDRRRRPCHGHTAMHTAPSSSIAHLARPPRRRPSIAVQVCDHPAPLDHHGWLVEIPPA